MKADRLLSAMLLLQARGRLTGRELSERLEVSARTIHRDMEALSAAGIPIFAIRGAQGGWQIEKDWRTQVPGLDEAELSALLMTQPRVLGHPRLVAAAERAFHKVMAALPDRMRQQAAAMRERLYIDASGWHPSREDFSMLAGVQDAVARDCKLCFDYTRADGQKAPRVVDPLGIVAKGASWYLVARAPNGMRTFRVSRMLGVTPLATTFKRPAKFDLATYWKNSITQLQLQRRGCDATLSLHPQAAQSLGTWCTVSPCKGGNRLRPKGWLTFRVEFENEEQARSAILGLGPKARVLSPTALRERVLADARAIADGSSGAVEAPFGSGVSTRESRRATDPTFHQPRSSQRVKGHPLGGDP
jgi:predicted DNA-binding transcriptional regulator YafY